MNAERVGRWWRAALVAVAVGSLLTPALAGETAESDPAGDRFLFYLHGKIVEDQGAEAVSPRFGRYEYDAIVKALARDGITVRSEVRKKGTKPLTYAERVVAEIRELHARNVPYDRITVVGASKGAAIAVLVSDLLRQPDVRYVLLAICGEGMVSYWAQRKICVSGDLLSIYDESDTLAGSCQPLADRCAKGIGRFREIRLTTGTEHGLLYRPMPEWVEPTLAWALDPAPSGPGEGD